VLSPSQTLLITSAEKKQRKEKERQRRRKARCEPETVGSKNCRTDRPSVLLCVLCFSMFCFFAFFCWLLSRCLASSFFQTQGRTGTEPVHRNAKRGRAAVRCSVPAADGAGRHVAGAGVTGDAKRLWDGETNGGGGRDYGG
jgi:hypothetical protein